MARHYDLTLTALFADIVGGVWLVAVTTRSTLCWLMTRTRSNTGSALLIRLSLLRIAIDFGITTNIAVLRWHRLWFHFQHGILAAAFGTGNSSPQSASRARKLVAGKLLWMKLL